MWFSSLWRPSRLADSCQSLATRLGVSLEVRPEEPRETLDFRGFPSAPERTRTSTDHTVHKALNLARLPIPPQAPGAGSIASRAGYEGVSRGSGVARHQRAQSAPSCCPPSATGVAGAADLQAFSLSPSTARGTFSNTRSAHRDRPKLGKERSHGPNQAPAGDFRLHQEV